MIKHFHDVLFELELLAKLHKVSADLNVHGVKVWIDGNSICVRNAVMVTRFDVQALGHRVFAAEYIKVCITTNDNQLSGTFVTQAEARNALLRLASAPVVEGYAGDTGEDLRVLKFFIDQNK